MKISNKRARDYFFDLGYNWICFKPHTKRIDTAWNRKSNGFETRDYITYYTDHFNIFDGYMLRDGLVWFQVKTNAWAKASDVISACKNTKCPAIVVNVTNKLKKCKGKYKVFSREYS